MLPVTSIACLLLAWGNAPAILEAPKDHQGVSAPVYDVVYVKSGLEIVIKYAGKPRTVRLLGIDTPMIARDSKVDALNQTNHLRSLIQARGKLSLEFENGGQPDARGRLLAQARRASDGVWLNLAMLEQGFATTSITEEFPAHAEFAAAEQRAKTGQLGMWAPSFLKVAVQPTPPARPRNTRKPRQVGPFLALPAGRDGRPMNPLDGNHATKSSESSSSGQSDSNHGDTPSPGQSTSSTYAITHPYSPPRNPSRRDNFPAFWGNTSAAPYQNGGSFGTGSSGMSGAGHFGGNTHPGHSTGYGGSGYPSSSGSSSSGSSGSSSSSYSGSSSSSSSASSSSSYSGSSSSSSSGSFGHHR
jgi:endonuclease YncB( thermonuclease family)